MSQSPPPPTAAKQTPSLETSSPSVERTDLTSDLKAPTAKWTLLAKVRGSMGANGKPFPGLAVEAGVGVPLDPSEPVLARATSDEHGDAELSIDWSSVEAARARPESRLWARVVADGYQHITRTRALPDEPGSGETILLTTPGATVRGRLFDASDKPVPGSVRAAGWTPDAKLGIGPIAHPGDDGWFELSTGRIGTYQIVADAGEHGTAAARDVAFPSADVVELHASGPGIVRGRVRTSNDKPARELELLVLLADLDDARGSFVLPEPRASQVEVEGRGRAWSQTLTDAQGLFEARGLRDDRYVVRARTTGSDGFPILLTKSSVPGDGAPLDLWLDYPHIVVHVVGPDGEPFVGLESDEDRAREHGFVPGTPPQRWPEKTDVIVLPARETAHLEEDFGLHLVGHGGAGGVMVFNVEDGRSYRVGLIGGASVWDPSTVEIPLHGGGVEVTLRAKSSPAGTLVVRAQDAQGETLRDIRVRIQDETDGATLLARSAMFSAESTQAFRLPAGSYRVAVESIPFLDSEHGTLLTPSRFGVFETTVRITGDAETLVTATMPAGARLHLSVPGQVLEADRTALHEQHPTWTFGGPIDVWAGRVSLWLRAEGHWPIPVPFTYELTGSSAAGTHVGDWIPIGTEATSQIVPAGKYQLVGRMSGGRTGSVDVVLVDGETTDATLELH